MMWRGSVVGSVVVVDRGGNVAGGWGVTWWCCGGGDGKGYNLHVRLISFLGKSVRGSV